MDYKRIKPILDQEMQNILKKAFDNDAPIQPKKYGDDQIKINFSNRRWATFFKFIGCAIQILFTGKTTLTVKRR